MSDEQANYSQVMPLVACVSNGGHYDDSAFVEGARFGQASAELDALPLDTPNPVFQVYVDPPMVSQYDLLAMHHGLVMEAEPWDEHPDEWVLVTMNRPERDDES